MKKRPLALLFRDMGTALMAIGLVFSLVWPMSILISFLGAAWVVWAAFFWFILEERK